MQPTTIASRRAVWGDDARQLVADLVRAANGGGGETWRIAYLAGARVEQLAGCLDLVTARIRPHLQHRVRIRLDGTPPGQADLDAIAWHMDQDARTGDLSHEERETLPAGALLFDPLFATMLSRAGISERDLRNEVECGEDGLGARSRRVTPVRLRGPDAQWAQVEFHMNEVRAEFMLPGPTHARWKAGYLEVATGPDPMPETVMLGMRGRRLSDIVGHALLSATPAIAITGCTHMGTCIGMTTDATTPARLAGLAPTPRAIAA